VPEPSFPEPQDLGPEAIGLIGEIARGGMRAASAAHASSLNRFVELKMILEGQIAGPPEVRRFDTKARTS
jgi:hypothetical protein